MNLVTRAWQALPTSMRDRVKETLASNDIGRISAHDDRLDPLAVILDAPTEMSFEERLFLYALVRGTMSQRVLEIGTSQGGSAAIIAAALEANGTGTVVGIDPLPRIDLPAEVFHGRFQLVTGESPGAIEEASRLAGGSFDLVLIDGIHIHQQAAADLAGALPFMGEQGFVLFHDSFHFGVSEAIREALELDATLHDCGYVCSRPRRVGLLLTHSGFRLVRRGGPVVDMEPIVRPAWEEINLEPPHDDDLRNHDIYYCEYVEPCAYCRREREAASLTPTV